MGPFKALWLGAYYLCRKHGVNQYDAARAAEAEAQEQMDRLLSVDSATYFDAEEAWARRKEYINPT